MIARIAVLPVLLVLLGSFSGAAGAAAGPACSHCAEWNLEQEPVKIYGHSWYVGPHGLGAILIDTGAGLVLIDGALPESAPGILRRVRALGHGPHDIRLILNTHVHFDHAGGIAAIQAASGAEVRASHDSAATLRTGEPADDDPQHGLVQAMAPVARVTEIAPGETIRLGRMTLTPLATSGHTHGGTSWSWQDCERRRCLHLVYADSLNPVSADDYRYTDPAHAARAEAEFSAAFSALEAVPCDILVTPHPDASDFWQRIALRHQFRDALVNTQACREYAALGRSRWEERKAAEHNTP
jgi:metallo-beta-lactamase class B